MNYTKSLDYIIHLLTGQRRHEDAQALPTVVSDTDVDAPIWEILEVVKAAGIMPKDFDYDDVTSYNQLYTALMKHIGSSPVTTYTATAGAALAVTLTKAQCGVVVVDAALNAVNLTLDVSNITAAACNDKQTYRWIFKRGDTSTKAVNVILPAYKKLIKTGQMSAASASTISVPLTAALDIVYDPQTNTFIENETVPMVTGTTTGTAAAYTVTTTPTFDAATVQTRAQLIIHTGNAGVASTIDINGTGARPFKQSDSTGALVNAVTFAGQIVDVVSNGTAWVMLDAANNVAAGTASSGSSVIYVSPLSSLISVTNTLSFTPLSNGKLTVLSTMWMSTPFTSNTGGMEMVTSINGTANDTSEGLMSAYHSLTVAATKGVPVNITQVLKNKSTTLGTPASRGILTYIFQP